MAATPSASYSLTLRLEIENNPGMLGRITSAIGEEGGDIGAIDLVRAGRNMLVRDITVNASSDAHGQQIVRRVEQLPGAKVVNVSDRTFLLHLGGKIEIQSKFPLKTRDDLSRAYTPGVARVCMAIHEDKSKAFSLTIKRNTVAVVTDGTAVLGLGDIGPEAAAPVMEGKAMLFKEFGQVDAFPICLATKDVDQIVATCTAIAPIFGGINLEDISAPRCFEIEERLKATLDIPVFHDDQHGTAIVVMAAVFNALKIVGKRIEDIKVVVHGVGAAGTACTHMLLAAGTRDIIGFDRTGAVYPGRPAGMNRYKEAFAERTNPRRVVGGLEKGMEGADLYLGLSGPDTLPVDLLKRMAPGAIVFAMANPTPEIMPEIAAPYATVMATGRSDYPNQINNVLAFPGVFRGALNCRAKQINEEMKLAAAHAIADIVNEQELQPDYIIPSVFNRSVADAVARAVAEAAYATGEARRETPEHAHEMQTSGGDE